MRTLENSGSRKRLAVRTIPMDVSGGAILHGPRVVIVRDVPEHTPSRGSKPFSSPPPMLGSPVVGELGPGPMAGSHMTDVRARASYPPTFASDSPHFPGQSFSAGWPQPSMKANSATLGYFREGTVMYPLSAANSVEQHQIYPTAEEGKKKQDVPGKRISAILGYELDYMEDCSDSRGRADSSTKARGITYYSQDRWKHVSDNFWSVRPEDVVEPTGCTAWIFSYSTDFSTSGMNWKNDKKEIMFHLRRLPDKIAPDRNRLVMNSCTEPSGFYKILLGAIGIPQSWEFEENVSFSPADMGDNKIVVCVDDAGFHVAWGGKVRKVFKHRVPWSSFQKFELDPEWQNSPDRSFIVRKSTTLQQMLTDMCITLDPVLVFQVPDKGSCCHPQTSRTSNLDKEVRGSGRLRVATWDGKERKFLTVEDTHQSRVKVGNIKEFICSVLDVPELTKEEFDKWYNLRRTHQWHTIFPMISSNSKEKQSILRVAKQNIEVLLTLHEERVLLELVLENSKPLLVSVLLSGAMSQYAREERSRDHRRANSADVLAAALENLACSIVHRVQLIEAAVGEDMDDVLEFATTHRMKSLISEPVIVAHVNSKWSDTNFAADFLYFIPDFLNPYHYQDTFVQCFLIPFFLVYVIVCVLPLVFLFSSWSPAWRFWAFQASYATYAMVAWYLPKLCFVTGEIFKGLSSSSKSVKACLEYGQNDEDCCGALRNLI